MDERQLLERLREGDEAAFRSLVARYHGPLLRFARRFVRNPATAEEVVQEAWLALVKGLPKFRGEATLGTWLFQVVANRARDAARREQHFVELDSWETEETATVDTTSWFLENGRWRPEVAPSLRGNPHRDLLDAEIWQALERALDQLPPKQRAAVLLRDVEGFSTEQTAVVLGVTEGHVRVLLHRGRTALRSALAPLFGTQKGED